MASIRKLLGSRFWIACYTDVTGKQRQRSTKETDRKKALSRAHEYEAAYRKLKTEQQARRVLSDIYEEIHGSPLGSASTETFLKQWIKRKEAELAPSSYSRYSAVVERFLTHLGEKRLSEISSITTTEITDFRDKTSEATSITSGNMALKVLRTVFTDAMRESLTESNPAKLVPIIKRKNATSQRRAFSLPELKLILEHASDEWKGIILAGLYTGQRMGDIVRLCWNNIDLTRQEIRLSSQKTGRVMILPIAKPLFDWLIAEASQDDPEAPIFLHSYDVIERQNGRVASLSNQFNKILVSAGLAPKRTHASQGKGRSTTREVNALSFHCLRHTATSLLKNAGVSEAVAMDIVGHDSKMISQNYTHIEENTKRKALDSMPDITKG
ncbi:tyrosine-type recombinase/integrase [Pontiella sulfatireligans]|uniref:Tyrosine recombinase XerD n=1 Tax=Pontiella sulfatireligans TaxID=2750658 RepID=A0A6C2UDL6_9BACT|nr:tyrosine-type recombinase/integrase [Pontiella sulfatireligans]VGO18225.1 Tyrosine recombinase XerD [Pontiella sulfatireligans]